MLEALRTWEGTDAKELLEFSGYSRLAYLYRWLRQNGETVLADRLRAQVSRRKVPDILPEGEEGKNTKMPIEDLLALVRGFEGSRDELLSSTGYSRVSTIYKRLKRLGFTEEAQVLEDHFRRRLQDMSYLVDDVEALLGTCPAQILSERVGYKSPDYLIRRLREGGYNDLANKVKEMS